MIRWVTAGFAEEIYKILTYINSEHAAEGLREQALGTAYVSLPSNQTGNKQVVCSLSASQFMWQIFLFLPGPNGKIRYQNPVPKC